MKYKLATLPRGTAKLPVLDLGFASITLKQGAILAITPQTLNYLGNEFKSFILSKYKSLSKSFLKIPNFNTKIYKTNI